MNLTILSTVLLSITPGVFSKPTPQAVLDCYNTCWQLGNDEIMQCVQNCSSGQTARLRGTSKKTFPPDQPLTCRQACDLLPTISRNSCYEDFCSSTHEDVTSESFLGRSTCDTCKEFQSAIDRQFCADYFNCDGNENSASFVKSSISNCDICGFFLTDRARNACYDFNDCDKDPDASLQDATFVESAAPGAGTSILNCIASCENESNVEYCIGTRCFGSETFIKHSDASFQDTHLDEATSESFLGRSICDACNEFQSVISRNYCLDFYNCDGNNENHSSFVKSSISNCDICGFFFTERARNACYDFNNCDADPDASLQDATFVESAAPGAGASLLNCILSCQNEGDIAGCINQRCYGSETGKNDTSFVKSATSNCGICDYFLTDRARKECYDFSNCDKDHDASLQEATFVKSAAPGAGTSLLHCFLSCQNESNVADCINQRCVRSETFIEGGEKKLVNSTSLRDTALDMEFQEYVKQARLDKQVEEAEFVSTDSSCLNRGSSCDSHRDCCDKFCSNAFFPSRCI